jgi:peptide-methionine (S)-S-oxide reductase
MSRILLSAAALAASAALFVGLKPGLAAETLVNAPRPALVEPVSGPRETAIFAGGCFWGVQGVFAHVKGVVGTTAGYTGGKGSTAQYEEVSTGTTGHAEAVKVVFDPRKVNYTDLLRIYFSVVTDPTQVNRQGPDSGPQYRSALFPQSPAQARVAQAYIAQLSAAHVYRAPVATRLETAQGFFPAEGYHQDFMAKNPDYPYIVVNDRPKVEALRRIFPQSWKA